MVSDYAERQREQCGKRAEQEDSHQFLTKEGTKLGHVPTFNKRQAHDPFAANGSGRRTGIAGSKDLFRSSWESYEIERTASGMA
jgi:hypothetical protein